MNLVDFPFVKIRQGADICICRQLKLFPEAFIKIDKVAKIDLLAIFSLWLWRFYIKTIIIKKN